MTLPELKQLPTHEEVDALKAQVNYLRHKLIFANAVLGKEGFADHIVQDIEKALELTKEQCLSLHDAKLKAQVNCLRRALVDATSLGFDFYGMRRNDRRARIAINALESTTEQCLDEVKALAISEAQLKLTPYTIDGNTYYLAGDVAMYTKQLWGQAE